MPREPFTYHWADYAELMCLTDMDGQVSPDDLLERWKAGDDLTPTYTEDEDDPVEVPRLPAGATKASVDDFRSTRASDVFEHIKYRAKAFGDDYPFDLVSDAPDVLAKRAALTDRHKLYIFLLVGSLLRYVPIKRRGEITDAFERLTAATLQHWFPADAMVDLFGTTAPAGSRYAGTMREKIARLAKDIGEVSHLSDDDFHENDRGDLGLDVVARLDVGDNLAGLPVFFAQATCELRWKDKQHESGRNWSSYLQESAPRGNLLFVPYCFRDPTGKWFDVKWVTAAVLIDRQRILWLLRDVSQGIPELPYSLVDEAIAMKRAV